MTNITKSLAEAGSDYLFKRHRLIGRWRATHGKDSTPPEIALMRAAVSGTSIEEEIASAIRAA